MKILILLNNFLAKNRKNIIYILWFLAVFFVLSDFTFAWWGETASSPQDKDKSQVITALNEALKAIAVVLTLWTNFVWWFLYPEWTSWKIIWIDQTLKTLWIMVSNIVYFIFAWIFIWIAFMNIIWKDWETYELKKAIPRFIIWVLIVPFSWFFVQFIISISSIFTAAVLSLPMTNDLYSEWSKKVEETKIKVCNWWYTIKTWTPKALEWDKNAAKSSSWSSSWTNYVIKCESENEESLSKILTWNGIYSIMYFYTFWVMKFDDYGKLFSWDLVKWVTDILDLIFKTWFSIIFIVVYAILVIALGLALFVRVLRLWFFALFSPIFWLLYFFKKDWGWEWVVKNFNVKNFISLALVPVYVSAALAFWMVFILTADTWIQKSWLIKKEWENHCVNLLPDTASKWNQATKVCWDWVYHGENNKATESFKWFVWNFWNFLLQVFGIIFLRMWVIAALKSSDITKEVVDPIAWFWDEIWKLMRKAPTYAPIIPTGSGAMSAHWLSRAGSTLSWNVEQKFSQQWSDFWQKLSKAFGVDNDSPAAKMNKLINETNKALLNTPDWVKSFVSNLTQATWDIDKFLVDKAAKDKFVEGLKLAWVADEKILTKIKDAHSSTELWNALTEIQNDANASIPLKNALRAMGWTTKEWALASFNWTQKATAVAWDVSKTTISDYDTETKDFKIIQEWKWDKLAIRLKKADGIWVWSIAIANNDWKTWDMLSLKFEKTPVSATTFSWPDLEEAIALYKQVNQDEKLLKNILDQLWFKESEKLANSVASKYNEQNKKS